MYQCTFKSTVVILMLTTLESLLIYALSMETILKSKHVDS